MKTRTCIAALAAVLAAACGRPPEPAVAEADLKAARETWTDNCAACHFVPDDAIDFDRVWLESLQTTS